MFSTVCLVVSLFSSLVESWNNEVTVKTTVLSQSSMSDYISFMVRYGCTTEFYEWNTGDGDSA